MIKALLLRVARELTGGKVPLCRLLPAYSFLSAGLCNFVLILFRHVSSRQWLCPSCSSLLPLILITSKVCLWLGFGEVLMGSGTAMASNGLEDELLLQLTLMLG